MPSGAKKRKAAKKKLHDNKSHHHNHNNNSNNKATFHSQGIDGSDVERESSGETAAKSYDGESKLNGTGKEVNEERKSSSSSSSDDDDADVEKDKSVIGEVGNERVKSGDLGSDENGVGAEVVEENVDESIPVEETVKEVVLANPVSDSVLIEDSSVPDVADSKLKQRLNEISCLSGKKVEAKEIPVVDNGLGNSSISIDNMAREVERENDGDDLVKEPEKVEKSEELPMISSAPLPVRRTSWMNCCGLFEVISGGSGR